MADGTIVLERIGQHLIVAWPPKDPSHPAAQQGKNTQENFDGIETSVLGSLVKVYGRRLSVDLPQRVSSSPKEFPNGEIVANAHNDRL